MSTVAWRRAVDVRAALRSALDPPDRETLLRVSGALGIRGEADEATIVQVWAWLAGTRLSMPARHHCPQWYRGHSDGPFWLVRSHRLLVAGTLVAACVAAGHELTLRRPVPVGLAAEATMLIATGRAELLRRPR